MAGISLYYSKKNPAEVDLVNISKVVDYLKFSETEIEFKKTYEDNFIAGVVNLDDQKGQAYFYSALGCDSFIEGSVFLIEDIKIELERKYSIHFDYDESYLPFLWKEHKEDSWKYILGWFNWLIIEPEKKDIYLINDRFGMLPCYYSEQSDCFAISSKITALLSAGIVDMKIDTSIVMQFIAFNYPVSDSTFIQSVKTLPSASILKISQNKISITKYWDFEQLLYRKEKLLSRKSSINLINETLLKVISRLSSRSNKLVLSLTGGWDGRLVLSYFDKLGIKDLSLYSFGSENNKDILIPQKLADKLGYSYNPVILDNSYVDSFVVTAQNTLRYSDGLRPISRTHYLFAAENLKKRADILFSGNCGSNIIKSVQGPSEVFNRNVLSLFSSDNIADAARSIFTEVISRDLLSKNKFNQDEFVESVRSANFSTNPDFDKAQKFYSFLLSNIERKYFGIEISSYSHCIKNYSPFIDFEFIDTITKTQFFGGYHKFLSPGKIHIWNVTQLYGSLMKMNSQKLANYPTDRGFALGELSTLQGLIKSLFIYWKTKKRLRNSKIDSFSFKKALNDFTFNMHNTNESFIHQSKIQNLIHNTHKPDSTVINALSWSLWFNDLKHE